MVLKNSGVGLKYMVPIDGGGFERSESSSSSSRDGRCLGGRGSACSSGLFIPRGRRRAFEPRGFYSGLIKQLTLSYIDLG